MNDENLQFGWREFVKAIWYLIKSERKKLLFFYVILFVLHFWQLVPPILVGKIIDFFANYQPGQSLDQFYAMVVFLGGANAIVSFSRLSFKNQVNQIMIHLTYVARVEGFEKLIDFSLRWHDQENSGNKVQRIQTGVATLRDLARLVQNEVFELITMISGIAVVFFLLNPVFVLVMVIYIVGFTFIQKYFNGRYTELNRQKQKAIEAASGRYYEGLGNVLTIKTMGAQKSFKKNIVDTEEVTKSFTKRMSALGIRKWQVFQIFNSITYAVYLLLIGRGVATGQTTVGDILVLYNYVTRITGVMSQSMDLVESLIENKVAVGRMMPIFQVETSQFGTKHFPREWESIQIANGSFSYKENDNSLDNINLTIKKGQKIGVVGKSGSGKSTLAKVLMGLYPLDSGEFTIGNITYYSLSHEQITKHLALVLQESEMFNVSLHDNITLMKSVPADVYLKAIKIAQLEELIERLPDKEKTLIGEKGYRLSGGERQRIGLARVICKNPDILIMDEATSALDSKTESLIQSALEKELKDKTIISIAHRVSTLKNSDIILVFEKGAIVEQGSFEQLVANKKSVFNEIAKSQLKNV